MNKLLKYKAILFVIVIYVVGGFGLYLVSQPREIDICFKIYEDETVNLDIREHCRMIIEEWRVEHALGELKEKQDYIENFQEYKWGQ